MHRKFGFASTCGGAAVVREAVGRRASMKDMSCLGRSFYLTMMNFCAIWTFRLQASGWRSKPPNGGKAMHVISPGIQRATFIFSHPPTRLLAGLPLSNSSVPVLPTLLINGNYRDRE